MTQQGFENNEPTQHEEFLTKSTRKKLSEIDMHEVREIRKQLERLIGLPDWKKAELVFEYRNSVEKGITKATGASGWYPEECIFNENGDEYPSDLAIRRWKRIINQLNTHPKNTCYAIYAKRFNGNRLDQRYFNIETLSEYAPIQKTIDKIVKGLRKAIKRTELMLRRARKERRKDQQQIIAQIEFELYQQRQALKILAKKNGGLQTETYVQ